MAERPKYLIQADPPGMEIAGYGVVAHGTELSVPHDFPPRASMFPLNAAAKAAFDRLRAKVEKEYSAKRKEEGATPEQIKVEIKAVLAKVGPNPRRTTGLAKPKRPTFQPGTFVEGSGKPAAPEDEGDALLPSEPAAGGRASDSA